MGIGEAGGVVVVTDNLCGDVTERLLSHELLALTAHGGHHHLFINRIPPRLPKEECESLILEQLRLHPFVLQVSKCSVIPQNSLKNKGYGFITLNGCPSQATLKSIATSLNNKLQVGCRTLGVRVCTDCHNALLEEDSSTSSSSQDSSSPNDLASPDSTEGDPADTQLLDAVTIAVAALRSGEEAAPAVSCREVPAPKRPAAVSPNNQPGPEVGLGRGLLSRLRKGGKQRELGSTSDGARLLQNQAGQDAGRGRQPKGRGSQATSQAADGHGKQDAQRQAGGAVRGSGLAGGSERRAGGTHAVAQQLKPQEPAAAAAAGTDAAEAAEGAAVLQLDGEPAGSDAQEAAAQRRTGVQPKARRCCSPPARQQSSQQPHAATQPPASVGNGRGQDWGVAVLPPPPPSSAQAAPAPVAPAPSAPAQPQAAYVQPGPQQGSAPHQASAHARSSRSPSHGLPAMVVGAPVPMAAPGPHVRGMRGQGAPSSQGYGHQVPPHTMAHEPSVRPGGLGRTSGTGSAPCLNRSSAPPALRYQQHPKQHHVIPHGGGAGFAPHGGNGGHGGAAVGGSRRPPAPMLAAEVPDLMYGSPRPECAHEWSGVQRSGDGMSEAGCGPGGSVGGGRGASHMSGCASAPHLHPHAHPHAQPHAQPGRYLQQQQHRSAGSAAQAYASSPVQPHSLFQSPQVQHAAPHAAHQQQQYRHDAAALQQPLKQQLYAPPAQQRALQPQAQQPQLQPRPVPAQFAPMVSASPPTAAVAAMQLWPGSTGPKLGAEAQRAECLLPFVASEPPGLGTWRMDGLDGELDMFGRRSHPPLLEHSAPFGGDNGAASASASGPLTGQLRFLRGSSDGFLDLGGLSSGAAPGLVRMQSDELDPLALEPMIMQLLENDEEDDLRPLGRHSSATQPQRGSGMDWHARHGGLRLQQQLHAFGSVPSRGQVAEFMPGPSSFQGGDSGIAAWMSSRSRTASGGPIAEAGGGVALPAHGVAAAVAAAWAQPVSEAAASAAAGPASGPCAVGRAGPGGAAPMRGLSRESCGTLRHTRGGKLAGAAGFGGFAAPRAGVNGGGGCYDAGSLGGGSLPNGSMLAVMQRRDP